MHSNSFDCPQFLPVLAIADISVEPVLVVAPHPDDECFGIKTWCLDISEVVELKQQSIAFYRSQTSDLIDDDPDGFRLTSDLLNKLCQPSEIYFEMEQ